jgi:hypothetical protein
MSQLNLVDNLQELTGQESGIVIYGNEVVICNWSGLIGLPRVDPAGLIVVGMAEKIRKSKGHNIRSRELAAMLDGLRLVYDVNGDIHDLIAGKYSGRRYILDDNVIVVAPHGWE